MRNTRTHLWPPGAWFRTGSMGPDREHGSGSRTINKSSEMNNAVCETGINIEKKQRGRGGSTGQGGWPLRSGGLCNPWKTA